MCYQSARLGTRRFSGAPSAAVLMYGWPIHDLIQEKDRLMRMKARFIGLSVFLVLASIGWVGAWTFLSAKADEAFEKAIVTASAQGQQLECTERQTFGFPFRLAISCEDLSLELDNGLKVATAGMSAQAFVYRPNHQVVSFTSPATIRLGKLGNVLLTWENARLGSELTLSGVEAATARMEGAMLRPVNPVPELAGTSVTSQRLLMSARRTAANEPKDSLVAGAQAQNLEVTGKAFTLPAMDFSALVLAYDMAPLFENRVRNPLRFWISKGGAADIQVMRIQSEDTRVHVAGWVKLDNNGFWNADLNVDSANLSAFIKRLGPELDQIKTIGGAIAGLVEQLGTPSTIDEHEARRIKISIRKGFVQVGFVPVGTIPQIDVSKL
ncbi:MAG: DUF2125 domain-containing protein [Pseudomonadota bacterium]